MKDSKLKLSLMGLVTLFVAVLILLAVLIADISAHRKGVIVEKYYIKAHVENTMILIDDVIMFNPTKIPDRYYFVLENESSKRSVLVSKFTYDNFEVGQYIDLDNWH